MKRNVSLTDISDGRLYGEQDMVRADCHGCAGCSDCCRGMGSSIILDPYDVYRLTTGLDQTMQELLAMDYVELGVVDGVVLPHLRMAGESEQCAFLDGQGRCGIHAIRPGICRLFPLGRYYENGDFHYFLQTGECQAVRSKVKVSKWVDTPQLRRNHAFIVGWHYLLNELEEWIQGKLFAGAERTAAEAQADEESCRQLNMTLLQLFFLEGYEKERDFYEQYEERCAVLKEYLR